MPSAFLFDIAIAVVPDPEAPDCNIFLWIPESVAEAASVNSSGTNTLLANG